MLFRSVASARSPRQERCDHPKVAEGIEPERRRDSCRGDEHIAERRPDGTADVDAGAVRSNECRCPDDREHPMVKRRQAEAADPRGEGGSALAFLELTSPAALQGGVPSAQGTDPARCRPGGATAGILGCSVFLECRQTPIDIHDMLARPRHQHIDPVCSGGEGATRRAGGTP